MFVVVVVLLPKRRIENDRTDWAQIFTQYSTTSRLQSLLWRSWSVASLSCSTRKPRFSPISTDDQLVGRYFTEFYSKQPLCTVENPIPTLFYIRSSLLLPIWPIFRVRSPETFDDFRHISLKPPPNMMLTPSQQWQTTHDSAVLPIRPIFSVLSPYPFLTIFAIFSLKSPPNIHSGQGIHHVRVQRAFITCLGSHWPLMT